jgi:PAS domain-containing protein
MLDHQHPELHNARYVVFVDASRRYVDCTPAVSALLGYSRHELLRKKIDDISYDVSAVPKLFALFQNTGTMQGDFILQHKNHTPVPIQYRAFVFDDGCHAAVWDPITDWRAPYMLALLELDPRKQKHHIDRALAAIQQNRVADTTAQRVQDEAALLLKSMRNKVR